MTRRRRWLPAVVATVCVVGLSVGGSAAERWGPFRGQVVDVETSQPIAGAVAIAVWWRVIPGLAHGTQDFYDAREAVTGPDGRFEIPRLSVPPWEPGVQPGQVTLFAPAYRWEATTITPSDGERFVAPTVIQMRRLKTREELLKKSRARPAGVPLEKMQALTRAINAETDMLGLKPLPLGPVKRGQP